MQRNKDNVNTIVQMSYERVMLTWRFVFRGGGGGGGGALN